MEEAKEPRTGLPSRMSGFYCTLKGYTSITDQRSLFSKHLATCSQGIHTEGNETENYASPRLKYSHDNQETLLHTIEPLIKGSSD